jgi:hypothetical protein
MDTSGMNARFEKFLEDKFRQVQKLGGGFAVFELGISKKVCSSAVNGDIVCAAAVVVVVVDDVAVAVDGVAISGLAFAFGFADEMRGKSRNHRTNITININANANAIWRRGNPFWCSYLLPLLLLLTHSSRNSIVLFVILVRPETS